MGVQARKSGRRARKRAGLGDGAIVRLERDKDVRKLVAVEARDRTAARLRAWSRAGGLVCGRGRARAGGAATARDESPAMIQPKSVA